MAEVVKILLDRERTLKYRIADMRELERQLGNVAVKQLLERLADLSTETLVNVLRVGLRHEDSKITTTRAEELLQMAVDRDGSTTPTLNALVEALIASGIIGVPKSGNSGSPETSSPGPRSDS